MSGLEIQIVVTFHQNGVQEKNKHT